VKRIAAAENALELADGTRIDYDFLVVTTGPKLAFDEIPGFDRAAGYSESICTLEHAEATYRRYQEFLEDPGHIVVGAVQGASCFGPAYEFAMILDADLRKRKLRHRVPMTFVTSEPYIGHMGLAGVGDSKGLMEGEFRQRHIQWITNATVDKLEAGKVVVTERDTAGQAVKTTTLETKFAMLLPAFKGVDAVAAVEGLCNPRGFVLVDAHQRSQRYANIYAAGVCIAIPPVEKTPVPTGAPKTGYMIESMVSAIVENIAAELRGETPTARASMNAICLADAGDDGLAFVALPELPPRNLTWAKKGKWVHLAKVAFEKYFLHKVRSGNTDPVYERYVLKLLGIERLEH
jgi:sulfide:quinone oxidoreductase